MLGKLHVDVSKSVYTEIISMTSFSSFYISASFLVPLEGYHMTQYSGVCSILVTSANDVIQMLDHHTPQRCISINSTLVKGYDTIQWGMSYIILYW